MKLIMELLGKEKRCSLCFKSMESSDAVSLRDGEICSNCFSMVSDLSHKDLQTVKDFLSYKKEQNKLWISSDATETIGSYISVNDDRQLIRISKDEHDFFPDYFSYSELGDFELVENGKTYTKDNIGFSLIGAAFWGMLGAATPPGTKKQSNKEINNLSIKLSFSNKWVTQKMISLVSAPLKVSNLSYGVVAGSTYRIISLLERILTDNGTDETPLPTPATLSQADEIMKFKQLLDLGIITEEEFTAKKKKLLDL